MATIGRSRMRIQCLCQPALHRFGRRARHSFAGTLQALEHPRLPVSPGRCTPRSQSISQ